MGTFWREVWDELTGQARYAQIRADERRRCYEEIITYASTTLTPLGAAIYSDAARLLLRDHPDLRDRIERRQ